MLNTVQVPRGAEVELGSGNIFADLDLPDPDRLELLSGLLVHITEIAGQQNMSMDELARVLDLDEGGAKALLAGDFSLAGEHDLIACLNRLGYDVELRVRPSGNPQGTVRLA